MRFPLFLCALLLVGAGCTSSSSFIPPETDTPTANPSPTTNITIEDTVYTTFVINTHDWTKPTESIATINRIIDLHEEYHMPVDIYLNDPMVQLYVKEAPELIQRLKTSPYVAVSYHLRPPTPYYSDYREDMFTNMTAAKIRTTLLNYEEHAIDLTTGEPTDAPGGYEYLKYLMGYAPYVVADAAGNDTLHKTLAAIYKEKGATFTLKHNTDSALGSTVNGLYLRPENVEVKAYERKDEIAVTDLMTEALSATNGTRPSFLNLKWHENNFYSSGTSWFGIYFADGSSKQIPAEPPYDLSKGSSTQTDKTDEQERIQWDRYEGLLKYVKEHPETYTAINARNLVDLVNVAVKP
jgi:hypothetical protein